MFAFSAAVNDGRAQAAALPTGQLTAGNNFIATEEPGEPTVCSSDRGVSPYGRTVWYRWSSPGPGTAVFTATGFDTVLAVYAAGSNAPLRCDDDPVLAGPSRIALPVGPGEYFVQVAGYGFHATSAQGFFDVSAEFTPNPDRDGDGTANGADCQPDNPAVHPGAVDIPLNGVDEDCSGADAGSPDRDGDGSPNAADCQPDNAAVRPGAKEIPKNGIDDDCVNGDAPYPRLVSEPVLSTTRHNRYWNIRKIRVRRVPAGPMSSFAAAAAAPRAARSARGSWPPAVEAATWTSHPRGSLAGRSVAAWCWRSASCSRGPSAWFGATSSTACAARRPSRTVA